MGMYTPVTKTAERKSFSLKAQLVDDGRSLVPLAETQALWSWVKVYASGGEPLVLLRVGAKSGGGRLAERIGEDGTPLPGGSKKNKFAPPVYREGEYFE
ncbi:MAG: hypothetical protein HOI95_02580 [Chromatiales bacterium]|jgi:hypothetical protein|nr:hypothetical protein [Chromatiales bacterium]